MYTKTITLAGAELSSFLAGGGQTVNPAAATPVETPVIAMTTTTTTPAAVAQVAFPTLVTTPTTTAKPTPSTTSTTSTSTTTPVAVPSTSTSTSSSTSTSTSMAPVVSSKAASAAAATLSSAVVSVVPSSTVQSTTQSSRTLVPSSSPRPSLAAKATSSARASSVRFGANALNATTKKASPSSGISGGGIAGIIIGLLLGFALIGAIAFFWRKRRNDRRAEALEEKHQRDLQNEKGMVRLEESEVKSPGAGGGFDFGNLPPIAAAPLNHEADNFTRSASPAQMEMGAAVLGIKRPFTPPPGHPAHPNYKQPPALAAKSQMQQQPRSMGPVPQGGQANMPRKPVPAIVAPAPMQRSLSSRDPFADPTPTNHVAPPLAHTTSPVIQQSREVAPQMPRVEALPRVSLDSFIAGDDSFGEDDRSVAATSAAQAKPEAVVPLPETEPKAESSTKVAGTSPEITNSLPLRSKSVQEASDNWAARKAHLKNTLALQGSSKPTSPAVEQSPFADPAPSIQHEIATLSPMDLNFSQGHAE
ncbi:protein of unknown function [Taphrina deformans PYCC 5710]|uniref:Uncharacterized protein n=1 Tax=Taphrina deformans (strain PYCC 5710 / ATCC 11124 / CBS 356.35 / IMI 108563 / JCM 9778 / NBRC 8474) TaxID=1097556 RepID=R4XA07_TAPDE|nr:protein of unknown function [Taphrina deformans PYCC 5710]|eukprot:CCG82613.1 protein of unknown function [Taphrina deformans PYCC 5710]